MASMACPQDGTEMTPHERGGVTVVQCPECQGLFMRHADLGLLIEQENEWHVSSGPVDAADSAHLPAWRRRRSDTPAKQARSYLDELFG